MNSNTTGPSLHDWEREKREERANAFEKEFYWWRSNLYCNRDSDGGKKRILDAMGSALNNLYCDAKDGAKFEHAMFTWHCSEENQEAKKVMNDLLDKHIRAVIREEWESEGGN